MTYIFSGSDGIYTGASINTKPLHAELCVQILKSTLKTAGWFVMGSGDGNGLFSTSSLFGISASDVLTTNGTGTLAGTAKAGSISNGRCWFVLQQTSSSGSWSFQNLSVAAGSAQNGSTTWRIKYSSKGFLMSTSNTTTTPSTIQAASGVVDEMIVAGGGTDGSPTGVIFFSIDGGAWANCVADNTAPYGWYYVGIHSGVANRTETALLYEPLFATGSGEVDPYAIFARDENNSGTDAWFRILDNAGGTGPRAFVGPLVPFRRSNSQCCAMRYTTTETNDNPPTIPSGLGTNPFTGNEDVMPIVWAVDGRAMAANPVGSAAGISTTQGAITGYKGVGLLSRWLANSKSLGDTLTGSINFPLPDGTNSRMVIPGTLTHLAMPWSGTLVNV